MSLPVGALELGPGMIAFAKLFVFAFAVKGKKAFRTHKTQFVTHTY
ncbi:MAG TPA: hypothetical protein VGQ13_01865 [Nitrososphaera sp.]|nr:hypothetical protein [Nitrososphaera sp.]